MIQLNLLPDLKKEYLKAQKSKALVISVSIMTTIVALGLTVLIALYAFFGQQLQLALVNNDIKDKTSQLSGIKDLSKYLTIQNQLEALPQLHAEKGIYSRLFDILPIVNPSSPNNVNLSTLHLSSADNANTIVLTGTTATFQALNVFVDTLNNVQISYKPAGSAQVISTKVFKSVLVNDSALAQVDGNEVVTFTINTVYDQAVFDATNSNVTASVPNIVTTPSVTGSPNAVFGEGK